MSFPGTLDSDSIPVLFKNNINNDFLPNEIENFSEENFSHVYSLENAPQIQFFYSSFKITFKKVFKNEFTNPNISESSDPKNNEDNNNLAEENNKGNISISNSNSLLNKKRRGRKENNIIKKEKKKRKVHTKISKDNIRRKIQIHYITFLVKYINFLIKKYIGNKSEIFRNLPSNFKRNVTKDFFNKIKKMSIGEVLKNRESNKNKKDKNSSENKNSKAFESVYNKSEQLKEVLNKNYLDMFREIYAFSIFNGNEKNENIINIKRSIPKIELVDDLIENEKKKELSDEIRKRYIQKIKEECINYLEKNNDED